MTKGRRDARRPLHLDPPRKEQQRGSGLAVVDVGCFSVGPAAVVDEALHARLADTLRQKDVNVYAVIVKFFAIKPR